MKKYDNIKVHSIAKFYILILLKSRKFATGYYLLKRLKEDLGIKASPTDIYNFLKILKLEEYIEDIPVPNSKRPKGYRLTASGSEFVDKIIMRFDGLIEILIQLKTQDCANCDVKFYNGNHNETIEGKEMIFCCKYCAKAFMKSQTLDGDETSENFL